MNWNNFQRKQHAWMLHIVKNKGNVIRINRCHLIKMASDFVKIENDNDKDNYIETKPKTRQHVSNCTWRSGQTSRECG